MIQQLIYKVFKISERIFIIDILYHNDNENIYLDSTLLGNDYIKFSLESQYKSLQLNDFNFYFNKNEDVNALYSQIMNNIINSNFISEKKGHYLVVNDISNKIYLLDNAECNDNAINFINQHKIFSKDLIPYSKKRSRNYRESSSNVIFSEIQNYIENLGIGFFINFSPYPYTIIKGQYVDLKKIINIAEQRHPVINNKGNKNILSYYLFEKNKISFHSITILKTKYIRRNSFTNHIKVPAKINNVPSIRNYIIASLILKQGGGDLKNEIMYELPTKLLEEIYL